MHSKKIKQSLGLFWEWDWFLGYYKWATNWKANNIVSNFELWDPQDLLNYGLCYLKPNWRITKTQRFATLNRPVERLRLRRDVVGSSFNQTPLGLHSELRAAGEVTHSIAHRSIPISKYPKTQKKEKNLDSVLCLSSSQLREREHWGLSPSLTWKFDSKSPPAIGKIVTHFCFIMFDCLTFDLDLAGLIFRTWS